MKSLLVFACVAFLFQNPWKQKQRQTAASVSTPRFDSIVAKMKNRASLTASEIASLGILDSVYPCFIDSPYSEAFCDTTVIISKSKFYSIYSLGDIYCHGVCSYVYLIVVDAELSTVVSRKELYADCDIDFATDTYQMYDHKVVSPTIINVTEYTVNQKKERDFAVDESENIERIDSALTRIVIESSGAIKDN